MAKLHKLFRSGIVLIVLLSMLLAGCAPATTPTPAEVAPAEPAATEAPPV